LIFLNLVQNCTFYQQWLNAYLTYEPQWNSDVNSVYENIAYGLKIRGKDNNIKEYI
jgi:hypothetical protein